MIPNAMSRTVECSGDSGAVGSFGISRSDEAHLMTVLRDTLYSDKILAVLREYGANAWDAHREVGKGNIPISVRLPTLTEPSLEIRDQGPGLSRADVFGVFSQYGASTKRIDNKTAGMLGIGSKSGFAYSDSFTIVSRHAGLCSVYAAVLDASERGEIRLIEESSCPLDDTGLAIQIAVRVEDIGEFHTKAMDLFQHFDPQPIINVELPAPPKRIGRGALADEGWTAVMGCVPYRVQLNQLKLPEFIGRLGGVVYFDIGALHVAASREDLKYSDQTRAALTKGISGFVDDYVSEALDSIEQQGRTQWEKRVLAQPLAIFELPMLDGFKHLTAHRVELNAPAGATLRRALRKRREEWQGIRVHRDTRIVFKDDKRALRGFGFGEYDYIVCPEKDAHHATVRAHLDALIMAAQCEGLPVVPSSQLPWTAPKRESRPARAPKPRIKRVDVYRLVYKGSGCGSENWVPAEREPAADDLYVLLDKFEVVGNRAFYSSYYRDFERLRAFDAPVPEVFGYRMNAKIGAGIAYTEWRTGLNVRLRTSPKYADLLKLWCLAMHFDPMHRKGLERLAERCGNISLVEFYTEVQQARNAWYALPHEVQRAVCGLASEADVKPYEEKYQSILKTYPLLAIQDDLGVLSGQHADVWIDYIAERSERKP